MHVASGRSSGLGLILKLRLPGVSPVAISSSRPPSQRRAHDGFSPSSLLKRLRYLLPPSYNIDVFKEAIPSSVPDALSP